MVLNLCERNDFAKGRVQVALATDVLERFATRFGADATEQLGPTSAFDADLRAAVAAEVSRRLCDVADALGAAPAWLAVAPRPDFDEHDDDAVLLAAATRAARDGAWYDTTERKFSFVLQEDGRQPSEAAKWFVVPSSSSDLRLFFKRRRNDLFVSSSRELNRRRYDVADDEAFELNLPLTARSSPRSPRSPRSGAVDAPPSPRPAPRRPKKMPWLCCAASAVTAPPPEAPPEAPAHAAFLREPGGYLATGAEILLVGPSVALPFKGIAVLCPSRGSRCSALQGDHTSSSTLQTPSKTAFVSPSSVAPAGTWSKPSPRPPRPSWPPPPSQRRRRGSPRASPSAGSFPMASCASGPRPPSCSCRGTMARCFDRRAPSLRPWPGPRRSGGGTRAGIRGDMCTDVFGGPLPATHGRWSRSVARYFARCLPRRSETSPGRSTSGVDASGRGGA